jgi:hypothetical protein
MYHNFSFPAVNPKVLDSRTNEIQELTTQPTSSSGRKSITLLFLGCSKEAEGLFNLDIG